MSTRTVSWGAWPRWVLASVLLGWLGLAQAGLFEDDEARKAILDLRQTVKAQGEENAQLRRSLLDLQEQIERLKAEIAQSRGSHEALARDVSLLQQAQKDALAGVEQRLRRFEPVKVTLDGREFMADPAEKRDYDSAMDTFRKGDFVAAQSALTQFTSRYSGSAYMASALFWLGNAQYANKAYKESMAHFQRMLAAEPEHPRAPEALLAISNVQVELKDLKGARKTLEELIKTYPASEAAGTARERLPRLR